MSAIIPKATTIHAREAIASRVARVTDPIEKLARDICWAEFADPSIVGKTKAAYWSAMSQEARDIYLREAKHFAYLLPRMDVDVLNEIESIQSADFCIVRPDALDGG